MSKPTFFLTRFCASRVNNICRLELNIYTENRRLQPEYIGVPRRQQAEIYVCRFIFGGLQKGGMCYLWMWAFLKKSQGALSWLYEIILSRALHRAAEEGVEKGEGGAEMCRRGRMKGRLAAVET